MLQTSIVLLNQQLLTNFTIIVVSRELGIVNTTKNIQTIRDLRRETNSILHQIRIV